MGVLTMSLQLVNGAEVIASIFLPADTTGVLCLYRGQYVVWAAFLPTDGHTDGKWYCVDGVYCDDLAQARRVFCNRFLNGWNA
jgi:hypothetical protein